ncbi:MAG TPA: hypothetical protein VFZ00_23805 [Solirubrobacter sp.]|jgi:hypothetical protein|nr:hypothetical protein [Solirubrobacter sp.]
MATPTIGARDGIPRTRSNDPAVHRALVVVDPPMEGRDVANLQRATRKRLKARGLDDDVAVPTHGKFTLATAIACLEAQYFLGLRSDTYLRKDKHGHRVVTEGAQRIIRDPKTRTPAQRQRAKDRHAQIARGPRFFEELARGLGFASGNGVADALKFAEAQVGTKERPPGSNSGPKIDDWCRAAGFNGPVPWCGCFVNACIMAGGLPSGAGFIGFTPFILARAKNGTGGWSFHMNGVPGDLALFDDGPGGDPVVHVEIVVKRLSSTRYATIGGNTSSGNGSQSDGGMVARRERSTTGGFRIVGFARPPWGK